MRANRFHRIRKTLIVVAAIAALAPSAEAREAEQGNPFLEKLVGRLYRKGESFACFSRQFDKAHLTAHPQQRVTFMKALIAAYYRKSPLPKARGSYEYQISLAFRFRDRTETLTSVVECGDGTPRDSLRGGAHCAGPGNEGSHLSMDGRKVVVIRIPAGADLWAPGPVDQRHDVIKNPFGPDDRVFRLIRSNLKHCEDLAFDSQKPLRPHER